MKTQLLITSAALAAMAAMPLQAESANVTQTAVVEQKASSQESFGALASLPADADMWIALNVKNINEAVLAAFPIADEYPMQLHLLDSVAIGIKTVPEELLNLQATHYGRLTRLYFLSALLEGSCELGPKAQDDMEQFASLYTQLSGEGNTIAHHAAEIDKNIRWPELSFAVKARPGCEFLLAMAIETIKREIMTTWGEGVSESSRNGWTCISCPKEILLKILGLQGTELGEVFEALLDSNIYIAYKMQGDTLALTTSSTFEEATRVAAEGASLTQTEKVAFVDALKDGKALAAYYVSPKAINLGQVLAKTITKEAVTVLEKSVAVLASSRPESSERMLKGIDGLKEIHSQLERLLYPLHDSPATFVAWRDENIHMQFESDAIGGTFEMADVHAVTQSEPFVQIMASAYTSPRFPDLDKLIPALQSVAKTVELSFDAAYVDSRNEFTMAGAYAISCLNIWNKVGVKVTDSFAGGMTFAATLQTKEEEKLMPEQDNAQADTRCQPCLSLNLPLKDNGQFESNLGELLRLTQGMLSVVDESSARQFARAVTFDSTRIGENSKLYSHKDGYGYIVGDAGLTVSTDANSASSVFNKEMVLTGGGFYLNVNLAPIAELLAREVEFRKEQLECSKANDTLVQTAQFMYESRQAELDSLRQLMKVLSGGKMELFIDNDRAKLKVLLDTPCLK